MKKIIKIIGIIIENNNNEVLCALRSNNMVLPGIWEFPCGPFNPNEDIKETAKKIARNDLNLEIDISGIFHDNTHDYPDFIINLIAVKGRIVRGIPNSYTYAKIMWLKKEYLTSLNWAEANLPAIFRIIND